MEKKGFPLWKKLLISLLSAIVLLGVIAVVWLWKTGAFNLLFSSSDPEEMGLPSWIDPQLIVVDGASRRGEKLEAVKDIAVHYVGNPGTSAQANRNYFNNPDSEVSSHFVIGLEGEIILCVPLDEKSSATNHRNKDTISIEVCHPDATGKFNDSTYASLIRLLTWLCEKYELSEENVIRHYDVTGKNCPLYYVENPDAWEALKADVRKSLSEGKE